MSKRTMEGVVVFDAHDVGSRGREAVDDLTRPPVEVCLSGDREGHTLIFLLGVRDEDAVARCLSYDRARRGGGTLECRKTEP